MFQSSPRKVSCIVSSHICLNEAVALKLFHLGTLCFLHISPPLDPMVVHWFQNDLMGKKNVQGVISSRVWQPWGSSGDHPSQYSSYPSLIMRCDLIRSDLSIAAGHIKVFRDMKNLQRLPVVAVCLQGILP